MTAIVVAVAVWTVAIVVFVLVGAELKRVDAVAELVARRHTGGCGTTSLAPPAPSPARTDPVPLARHLLPTQKPSLSRSCGRGPR